MPADAVCPEVRVLRQVLLGEVAGPAAEPLLRHVEDCEACAATLQTLHAEDTLVHAARSQATMAEPAEAPAVRELVARLRELRPGAEGAAPREDSGPETAATQSAPSPAPAGGAHNFLAAPQAPGELGRLGPYRVLRLLGQGGMGMVFLAEDTALRRPVALKVMRPAFAATPLARERFLREARAAAAVRHDHVVTIYHVGQEGVPFLTLEFLQGETLEERLRREPRLPPAEAVRLGRQIAEGLAAAHGRGLIHRDVKPSNVFLVGSDPPPAGAAPQHPPRVKLLDFGLARSAVPEDETQLTQAGAVVGTPAYMAPEQACGEAVDPRSDLFSLGCVLYQMCAGRPPFKGGPLGLLAALGRSRPEPPRSLHPDVPAPLDDLIMRLLAREPGQRPASAQAVAQELARLEAELAGAPARPARGAGRGRRRAAALVLGLLALLAAGAVLVPQVLLRIRQRDGTETTVEVPRGATLSIETRHPAAAPAANRENPFVVVRAGGRTTAYPDLARAATDLRAGEAIEVHGNGPFVVKSLLAGEAGLTLRAAPGHRPQFVPAAPVYGREDFWFEVNGPLRLEGCDFRCPANSIPETAAWGAFRGKGGPWEVRGCRFFEAANSLLFVYGGPRLHVEDSLLAGCVRLEGDNELVELTNTIAFSRGAILLQSSGTRPLTVRLRRNTLVGASLCPLTQNSAEPLSFDAAENVFVTGEVLGVREMHLQGRIRWRGAHNLYASGPLVLRVQGKGGVEDRSLDLAGWGRTWGRPEEGSAQVETTHFQWDSLLQLPSGEAVAALRELARGWRVQTPGWPADAGPDFDLLGPGEAYARTLAAEGGPGPARPAPAPGGAFVRLRTGAAETGYPTLGAAVQAATQDGDVVEVRADGLVGACSIPNQAQGTRRFTLRAGAGYQPKLAAVPGGGQNVTVTLEGLDLPAAWFPPSQHIARLANCAFAFNGRAPQLCEGGAALAAGPDGRPAQIVHCLIPMPLRVALPPPGRLEVRNSVLGGLDLDPGPNADARADLDRCLVYSPGTWPRRAQAFLRTNCDMKNAGKVAFAVRRSVVEQGTFPFEPDYAAAFRLLTWSGAGNVYRQGQRPWLFAGPDPVLRDGTLGMLRAHFHSPETGSVLADPQDYDPRQWRLLPGSPGHRQGPDGRDLGADVDRVAATSAQPGPAAAATKE